MKITVSNYTDQTKGLDFTQFPETIQKGHDFMQRAGGMYAKSDGIKKTIDLYINKLNELQAKKHMDTQVQVVKPTQSEVSKSSPIPDKKKATTGSAKKVKAKSVKPLAKRKPATKKVPAKRKSTASIRKKAITKKIVHKPLKVNAVEKPVQQRKVFSRELQIIKRFANMHDKVKTIRSIELLHKLCAGLVSKGQLKDHKSLVTHIKTSTGSFITQMKAAKLDSVKVTIKADTLAKFTKAITGAKERLRVSYLSGIDSKTKRTGGSGEKKSVAATASKVAQGKSIKATPSAQAVFSGKDGFVRADQRKIVKAPDTFRLKGPLGSFLGDLQAYKLAITISGPRGSGKTYFTMDLANEFINSGYDVGFFSIEQGGLESKDTRAAIDSGINAKNQKHLAVTGEALDGIDTVKKYADRFDVVVIDSWQKLGLPNTDFDRLRQEHPKTIWVVIFQLNADGGMRNGVAAEFDAPVVLKAHNVDNTVKNNYVMAEKNRGNAIDKKYMIVDKVVRGLFEEDESIA